MRLALFINARPNIQIKLIRKTLVGYWNS